MEGLLDNARLDLLLAEHGRAVVVVLVAVGVLTLVATGWAVATPETETTPRMAEESVTTEVQTSVTVVDGGTLWEPDERLEDSSVYMLNASPELVVEPETRLVNETAGTPVTDGNVTHELTLRFEAARDGEPFWNETTEELNATPTVEDGVATSRTTVDVESYLERQRQLESELGRVGSVSLELQLRVAYDTARHDGTQRATTTVQLTDDAYWLEESLSASETNPHRIGTERTTQSRNPLFIAALSLLGTLSLAGAGAVVRRSPDDVEAARRAVHEQRYAEWISTGSIPMWIGDHHVSLDSLEDVVDVAIDANERVVHDRQRGLFAVVSGSVVYYYSHRGRWEETAWPELDLEERSAVVDADPGPTSDADDESPPDDLPELDGSEEFTSVDEPDAFDDDEDVWNQL
ncbi:DUF5305 domain-containing protein [Halopiger djelfimassiliensis]|uniref:DUF5305 domain-containing protein n=1 Tax=Halopiger djelfimassiliensis TaxID=1293047 RepID=UPI00067804BD|nr:DUF5305 domain-containing protein [Halopiger djelfimassiliensis]